MQLSQIGVRLAYGLLAAFGAVTLVFVLSRLTSDPAQLLAPPGSTPERVDALRASLGLDQSLLAQYGAFIGDLVRGDLGRSYWLNQDVVSIIGDRIGATVSLAGVALLLAVGIGVPGGLIAAFRAGTLTDRVFVAASMLGNSVPTFWMGPVLILLFAVQWQLFPPSGQGGGSSYVLPAIALAGLQGAILFRVTRGAALEVLSQDQVKLARAKGSGELRIALSHVLPNTLLPVLTMAGLAVANLLSSAIVVEVIFAWPGIGQTLIDAVRQRDFPLVQGVTIVFALAYVLINTVVDILYQVVDPRLRQAA